MLVSYFKAIFRSIRKHKFYAGLNIAGLAIGLTASLLIGLYMYDELTFDRFHNESDKVYHVGLHLNFGGQEYKVATSCPPLAEAMISNIPGVDDATRVHSMGDVVVKNGEIVFTESDALHADANFFSFFGFDLLEGNPRTVLKEPHAVVITPDIAVKYFGTRNAMGKTMVLGDNNQVFTVTGIVDAPPANSHIQFSMLVPANSDASMLSTDWSNNNGTYTYYRKADNTSTVSIDAGLRELTIKHMGPRLLQYFGTDFNQFEAQGGVYSFFSFSLSESHLSMSDVSDIPKRGNLNYVYLVGGVGLFVLLIACINFMNLATARSAGRAKEVGLRKSMGSSRSKLALQFLTESFIYVSIALVIALFSIYFLLPSFNLLSGKVLSFGTLFQPALMISIAFVYILVSLVSGSYPAFYLTAFRPIEVLRGNLKSGIKTKGLRASLVVFQFTVSITLIICTLIVFDQINFLINKDIGLDNKNILVIENTNRLGTSQESFYEAINTQSGVVEASYIDYYFPDQYNATSLRAAGTTRDLLFVFYRTDYNHKDVLKLQMMKGRFFSPDHPSDSMACIINEAAVKELGWTDPLSERFEINNGPTTEYINVIGVVKDFNFESSKWKAKPLVIGLLKNSNHLLVRYNPDSYHSAQEIVVAMEGIWKQYAPESPYEYTFLDQSFAQVYAEDRQLGKVFTVMSTIAVFVACLGLLGLAAFTAEQRTREIGIRKVLGASVMSVNLLLSKEFILLVGISFVIASTVAWFAMDNWLAGFAYRVKPSLLTFIVVGLFATVVAWLTIGYHFNKASRANPADALRYD